MAVQGDLILAAPDCPKGLAMMVQILADGFTLTEALRERALYRVAHAFRRGRDHVSRVVVRLSDINGPRGGADKRCAIEVRLRGARVITLHELDSDLYRAIDHAVERARRSFTRRNERRRMFVAPPRLATPEGDAG